MASEIKTKTANEVQEYMEVFLKRFREIKERDLVLKKFQQKDFDQKNLETILKYEQFKDYAILLQENHYFGRNEYINMFKTEYCRLIEQNNITPEYLQKLEDSKSFEGSTKNLSLRLDHFQYSQPKKMVQEQLKYIAQAVRAEKTLRDHMQPLYGQQKHMRMVIRQSNEYAEGYQSNLTRQDQSIMHKEYEEQKNYEAMENKKLRKVTKVSDDVKFGRGRSNIAKLFNN